MEAFIVLFFLLMTNISMITCQKNDTKISLGSSLNPNMTNSYWLSSSGQFAFGFYKTQNNGYEVGIWFEKINQKTVTWTANRDGPPISNDVLLILRSEGRLVLQDEQGLQKALIANSSQPAASASMLDSGNFVLYNSNSTIIWQSFDHPTDTLLPGQSLVAGNQLVSAVSKTNHSTGRFRLQLETSGNLGQYLATFQGGFLPEQEYWTSDTEGDNLSLNLDSNGQLYLVNSTGFNIKNVIEGRSLVMCRLTIDVDGIFRLYSHNLVQNSSWFVEWSSTTNLCAPIGLCGINSYCQLINQEPVCLCLPGLDYIDKNQKTLGCNRNSTIEGCDKAVSIAELDGLRWEPDTYEFLSLVDKDTCKQSCLNECNCQAAFSNRNGCYKQKFPLRFAKAGRIGFDTTIIKVHNGSNSFINTDAGTSKHVKKEHRIDTLIIGLTCTSFSLIIILFSLFFLCRNYFRPSENELDSKNDKEVLSLKSFTYHQLELATNGFNEQLGRGAFGTVFKGILPYGDRAIAVKRLEKVAAEGEVEFRNEMRSIGRTHHRNLLRLLGFCHEGSNRLLVYDFMSNGSLANFLYKSEVKPSWNERVCIAQGIARGLLYLHEECENQIIHCDINPNNILIDENHCAKIADFGLAKLLMPDQTRTMTGIRGTRGFVAPEWHKNMAITAKADVYSFGIVLLVITCCRPHVDVNVPEKEAILVDWVCECFKANKVRNLVQDEEVNMLEFEKIVKIGVWCIQEEPSIRPGMKKVVSMFEGSVDIPVPPSLSSYGSDSNSQLLHG
ncbi:G-type lectin S-receptor-like serine/threonine-protein kinase LECRK1 [Cannabis sativa]|uniref:G-type lectin S-receptor-like serine/threonine-protein kinase LECRK1 n=1 Tax=Cannabis sativa TaxID=3483 RepID=UPI0029CA3419|nr:G-type lectin S-receptor-like serine/threonine-protein kinase LECRK1 [Cannabis sativa]